MTLKTDIQEASADPADLERLYQLARTEGNESPFRASLFQVAEQHPENILLQAWTHRLGLPGAAERAEAEHGPTRRWWAIIGGSVLLGIVSALLAADKPPVPDPSEANLLFWVGWGPLVGLGVLAYLAWTDRSPRRLPKFAVLGGAIVLLALFVGLTMGTRTDDVASLAAIHLPFVAWGCVGVALSLSHSNPARQSFAYGVKSVEAILTGGIFFGAGLIFVGLTYGIFAVLGIQLPPDDLRVIAAWAIGAIPLLAVGSAYDPSRSPAAQDWQAGLTRTLRILARLLLPLALGVLLVYVLWFIPAYFWKPFEERDVLMVYNITILAILVLLAIVVSGPADDSSVAEKLFFRYAVLALGALTLILNVYALAAVVTRAAETGITPNRLAVIGWNVTTLLILVSTGWRLWRARREPWLAVFRESIGASAALAVAWAVVLLIVLPFFG
jgi:hypothetical protein